MATQAEPGKPCNAHVALIHFFLGPEPEIRSTRWPFLMWMACVLGIAATSVAVWGLGGGLAIATALAAAVFQIGLFELLNVPLPWFLRRDFLRRDDDHSARQSTLLLVAGIVGLLVLLGIFLFIVIRLPNGLAGVFALVFLFETVAIPVVIALCANWCVRKTNRTQKRIQRGVV